MILVSILCFGVYMLYGVAETEQELASLSAPSSDDILIPMPSNLTIRETFTKVEHTALRGKSQTSRAEEEEDAMRKTQVNEEQVDKPEKETAIVMDKHPSELKNFGKKSDDQSFDQHQSHSQPSPENGDDDESHRSNAEPKSTKSDISGTLESSDRTEEGEEEEHHELSKEGETEQVQKPHSKQDKLQDDTVSDRNKKNGDYSIDDDVEDAENEEKNTESTKVRKSDDSPSTIDEDEALVEKATGSDSSGQDSDSSHGAAKEKDADDTQTTTTEHEEVDDDDNI